MRYDFPATAFKTETGVDSSASSVALVAANEDRIGLIINNVSTAILHVKFGGGTAAISKTGSTISIPANTLWTMQGPVYQGALSGIWAAANGYAVICELESAPAAGTLGTLS